MKRPSFQFYPGDWMRDAALRSCSLGARGLWTDMLCLMHEGSPYGFLKVGAKVILPANLARMCGTTLKEAEGYLHELETAGVFSRDGEGCIYCRRMVKDEKLRNLRAAGGILGAPHGKKGGRPAKQEGVSAKPLLPPLDGPENNPPSSSSSSSSAFNTPLSPTAPASPPPCRGTKKTSIPASDTGKRIGAIFHRRPETPWSDKERKALDQLGQIHPDDLALVERRYAAQWPPDGENHLRTSLLTFLNNFAGEVDRSRAFALSLSHAASPRIEPPRGEFAKPFHPVPQKPQHVIDREHAARQASAEQHSSPSPSPIPIAA